jgi:hypothetical protein
MESKALHSTFTDFKHHKSARSPNARFLVYQSLKTHYPNHHVVSVNPENAEFLEYADAGHAIATLNAADDHLERCRKYVAPSHGRVDKDSVASLTDEVYFGMWDYKWQGMSFTLYRASWTENAWASDYFWWYVLYPKNAPKKAESEEATDENAKEEALDVVVSEDGNCHDIDRLLLALGRWTSIPHNDIYGTFSPLVITRSISGNWSKGLSDLEVSVRRRVLATVKVDVGINQRRVLG